MMPPRKTAISRVEAFSDGMMAVAAALLVVSLEAPRTYDELINVLYGFVPFGLSFAALIYMWYVHTVLFRRYPLNDGISIIVNGVLMFTILFYVYPLKFLATSFASLFTNRAGGSVTSWEQLQSLFIIYALGWIVVFLLVALLYRRASATRDSLGLTPLDAYDAITWSRHYLGFVAAGVLSILVALTGIGLRFGLPGMVYATIGIFSWLNFKSREKEREELAATVAAHPQLADTKEIPRIVVAVEDAL